MSAARSILGCAAIFAAAILCFHRASQAQTVVQLPSYHVFSASTGVLVPDRGGAYLGGVNSGSTGSINQGFGVPPFANSATSATSAGGGVWASAQIHDFEAMDAALLAQGASQPLVLAPQFLNRPANSTASSDQANNSVAALKANAAAAAATVQQQAADNLAHAKQCLAEGKPAVAKIYFQMAAKHATGEVQKEALAALEALNHPKSAIAGNTREN